MMTRLLVGRKTKQVTKMCVCVCVCARFFGHKKMKIPSEKKTTATSLFFCYAYMLLMSLKVMQLFSSCFSCSNCSLVKLSVRFLLLKVKFE